MSKASYIDPDANFCARVPFEVAYLPGAYVLQSLNPPYNSVSFDNKTFPTRYYYAGKSNWDQYLVDWSLCDYHLSFGVTLSTPPDYLTLCNLLLSRRIPGFDEGGGAMPGTGVQSVESSGGPGIGLIDDALSSETGIVLRTIDSDDDTITLTDHSSHINATVNIYSLARPTPSSPYYLSFLSDAASTASVSATTDVLQLFSTNNITISSALGNYSITGVPQTPATEPRVLVLNGSSIQYMTLKSILEYNKLAFNVTPVSVVNPLAMTQLMSVTPVNFGRWSQPGQTMRIRCKGYIVTGNAAGTLTVQGRIDGVAPGGGAGLILNNNTQFTWVVVADLTILSVSGNIASCEYFYDFSLGQVTIEGSFSSTTNLALNKLVDISIGHSYSLWVQSGNNTVTQTSMYLTLT